MYLCTCVLFASAVVGMFSTYRVKNVVKKHIKGSGQKWITSFKNELSALQHQGCRYHYHVFKSDRSKRMTASICSHSWHVTPLKPSHYRGN